MSREVKFDSCDTFNITCKVEALVDHMPLLDHDGNLFILLLFLYLFLELLLLLLFYILLLFN